MDRWTTLSEDTILHVPPYLRVVQQRVRLPDGREIPDFYQVHLRSFAAIVPVTAEGEVLTLWTYKHGPGRVSLTFPAGFVEEGEPPQDAAGRELLEETGYRAGAWRSLGRFTDNGNQRGCQGHFYLATGCVYDRPAQSGDLEEMDLRPMTVAAIDAALDEGEFAITHMVAAWGLARRHLTG